MWGDVIVQINQYSYQQVYMMIRKYNFLNKEILFSIILHFSLNINKINNYINIIHPPPPSIATHVHGDEN